MITILINNNDGTYMKEIELHDIDEAISLLKQLDQKFGLYQISIGVDTENFLDGYNFSKGSEK